jgi:hypothetical protein
MADLRADGIQIGVDLKQIAWRLVLVKVAVEGDFVTDDTNLTILGIAFAGIYPGVRYVRLHFLDEICLVYGLTVAFGSRAMFSKSRSSPSVWYSTMSFTIDGKQPI